MTHQEYQEIRNTFLNLNYKITKSAERSTIMYFGKQLGFWQNNVLVMDSDNDSNVLFDLMIYEKGRLGRRLIDEFYDSDVELNDLEEEILEGQVNACFSLFQMVSVDKARGELRLKDVLNPESPEVILMELSLSQSDYKDILIFTRLVPIRGVYMSSGMAFIFPHFFKEQLLNDISLAKFKKRTKLNSSELFQLAYRKNKVFGISIEYR